MDFPTKKFLDNISPTDPFLLLPDEQPLLTTHQHRIAIIPPIVIAVLLGVGTIGLGFTASNFFSLSPLATFLFGILSIILTLSLITKITIDWYFHVYMVTNRRILEIKYRPFFSQDVNDVLLDQVRCTEVDIKIHGYIHALIDTGDIIITFDRPTHEEEFVLHEIKSPRKIGTILGKVLNTPKAAIGETQNTWYNRSFIDELMPLRQPMIQIV